MVLETVDDMKRTWTLRQYLGKEVYVVAQIAETDSLTSSLHISTDREKLFSEILAKEIEFEEYKCIHGVLMPAEVLPQTAISHKNVSFYLIILDSTGKDPEGVVSHYSDLDTLIGDVGDLIQERQADIEDLYIVYGYDIELRVSINDSDIDQNIIKKSLEIAKSLLP